MNAAAIDSFKIIKQGFLKGIGLAVGFATTSIFAAAAAINVFSPGEVISAAKINQNFAIAAPGGAIMAFYRTDCPDGWAPADGTNGTPDLRGQFIRGRDDVGTGAAGNDPDGARAIGATQQDALQGHRHSVTAATIVFGSSIGGGSAYSGGTGAVGDPIADASSGAPRTAHETRPKNVALTYCMRKN